MIGHRLHVVVLVLTVLASAAEAQPEVRGFGAARVGVHHTVVDKDDGAPNAYGPRFEISGGVVIERYVSVSALAAFSSYSDEGLYDGVTNMSYDAHVTNWWLGARVLAHPHWRVFGGLGVSVLSDDATNAITPELVLGANVIRTSRCLLQVVLTAGRYDRFDGLEHVEFTTLNLGAEI